MFPVYISKSRFREQEIPSFLPARLHFIPTRALNSGYIPLTLIVLKRIQKKRELEG